MYNNDDSSEPKTVHIRSNPERTGATMGLLDGKKVLLSGVGLRRGIGTTVMREVISQGGTPVITCYPTMSDRVGRMPEARDLEIFPCDFSNEAGIARMCEDLFERGLRLEGFLHSVANAPASTLEVGRRLITLTTGEAIEAIGLNALSFLWLTRHLLGGGDESKRVLSAEAVAVAMTFQLGSQGVVETYWPMAYSKALLECLALYLAQDLGQDGVRVHLLNAGPIDTMAARGISNFMALYQAVPDLVPLGMNTAAEDVARGVVYLLSSYSEGADLVLTVSHGLGDQGIIPVQDRREAQG